jgi:hypothetical protein
MRHSLSPWPMLRPTSVRAPGCWPITLRVSTVFRPRFRSPLSASLTSPTASRTKSHISHAYHRRKERASP